MTSLEQVTVQGMYLDASKIDWIISDETLLTQIISAAEAFNSAIFPWISYVLGLEHCKVGGELIIQNDFPPWNDERTVRNLGAPGDLKRILNELESYPSHSLEKPTQANPKVQKKYGGNITGEFYEIPVTVSVSPRYSEIFNIGGDLTFFGEYNKNDQQTTNLLKLLVEANISAKNPLDIATRLSESLSNKMYATTILPKKV